MFCISTGKQGFQEPRLQGIGEYFCTYGLCKNTVG